MIKVRKVVAQLINRLHANKFFIQAITILKKLVHLRLETVVKLIIIEQREQGIEALLFLLVMFSFLLSSLSLFQ